MDIDFILDTVCIWSYIGKRRLEKALKSFPNDSFTVNIHPFFIAPPDEFFPYSLKMRLDPGERTRSLQEKLEPYLDDTGIYVSFKMLPNVQHSAASHLLVRRGFAENKGMETLEAVFQAYFTLSKDIGKVSVLLQIAEELNLDINAFQEALEKHSRHPTLPPFWRKEGVRGVPSFIFDRKLLISGAQSTNSLIQLIHTAKLYAAEQQQEIK